MIFSHERQTTVQHRKRKKEMSTQTFYCHPEPVPEAVLGDVSNEDWYAALDAPAKFTEEIWMTSQDPD